MLEHTPARGFDDWWNSLSSSEQSSLNRYMARRAYVAGTRAVARQQAKATDTYRFQAGKWRVTVSATSLKAAKIEAIKKLDQRAEKLGAEPPANGWQLVPFDG